MDNTFDLILDGYHDQDVTNFCYKYIYLYEYISTQQYHYFCVFFLLLFILRQHQHHFLHIAQQLNF